MLSVGFLFLYTRFIWLWSYLALCRAFLSHRCFLCYEKLHWVSVLSCVCVCARTRETENKRSRRRLMRTHIAHTAYFFFFFSPFFLPPRFSLSSALERVRSICVMWQKTAQPRLGEREEWKQSKAYIQLGCLGVFTHTSQTIMSVCSHGDHL